MGQVSIVSLADNMQEYKALAREYNVSFEVNDFYHPDVLENPEEMNRLIAFYQAERLPDNSTMHGAFFDVVVFSYDSRVREISELRMEQSMKVAVRLGVKGVVFHTNYSPMLSGTEYDKRAVDMTARYMECLLKRYPDTDIYLENMFDTDPRIMRAISEGLCSYGNYGICFDYAHASISNTPMEHWVKELAPYMKHIHINDNDFVKDMHLAIGDGKINWSQFMRYRERYFQDCSVLIETRLPEAQRRSLEYLERNYKGFLS